MSRILLPEQQIIEDYNNGLNAKQVALKYNCSSSGVLAVLDRNNVVKRSKSDIYRKYNFNENYFEEIDNPNKAYWLGFIAADGCVTKRNNTKHLTINLGIKDLEQLNMFKEDLEYNGKIYILPERKRNPNKQCLIRINSTKLCEDLFKHNITERKTFTLKFPDIEDKFYLDFIRGYFDGDGCVYINRYNNPMITIKSGSKELLIRFMEILNDKNIHSTITSEKNIFVLNICSVQDTFKFKTILYNNAFRFMFRKYEKLFPITRVPLDSNV